MSVSPNTEEDRSADLARSIRPAAPWRVTSVEALPDHCLKVRFVDGVEGYVRMQGLVWSSEAGVFEALRDPAVFAQAYVSLGTVTWPGQIDLAPDAMHDEIEAHGEWVLA